MAIVLTDWLNANEGRNYPLHDEATRTDVDGKTLPNDVLVDASIRIPRSAGEVVYVSSVGITPALFSLTFLAGPTSAFCPGSLSGVGFTPLAVLTLSRPITRFKNYALTPLLDGVGGWVSLGAAANELSHLSLRFDDPIQTQLLDRVVYSYGDLPVGSIGKAGSTVKLTGLVKLLGTAGAIRTFKTTRVIGGITRDVVAVGIDLGEAAVTQLQDLAGACGGRPQVGTCLKDPIESIQGVTPDVNGNIELEFKGEEIIGDVKEGIVIDYPIGISDVAPFIGSSTDDTPPIVSSESGPPESSESGPDEPVGSSVSGPGYCEDFEYSARELVIRIGSFSIIDTGGLTKRYTSSAGYLGAQIALDPSRLLDAADYYIVKSTIRPLTLNTGGGQLIFGYKDINDFMFVGMTLRGQSPLFPNGRFFFGHKVSTVVNWPAGLGDGHVFDISYAPPAPLIQTDYRIFVQIEKLAPTVFIAQLEAVWDDGVSRSLSQTFV